jgi:hypothetical protein
LQPCTTWYRLKVQEAVLLRPLLASKCLSYVFLPLLQLWVFADFCPSCGIVLPAMHAIFTGDNKVNVAPSSTFA